MPKRSILGLTKGECAKQASSTSSELTHLAGVDDEAAVDAGRVRR